MGDGERLLPKNKESRGQVIGIAVSTVLHGHVGGGAQGSAVRLRLRKTVSVTWPKPYTGRELKTPGRLDSPGIFLLEAG